MEDIWASVRTHLSEGGLPANVRRTRGQAGADWLTTVEETARTLTRDWGFTPLRVHPASYRSLVLQGHIDGAAPAALKIEPVGSAQAVAVAAFHRAGHGPRVYASRAEVHATLLEWVPGTPLPATAAALEVAADAVLAVHAALSETGSRPGDDLDAALCGLAGFQETVTASVATARERLAALPATARPFPDSLFDRDLSRAAGVTAAGLLHGDLVAPNVLLDATGRVRLIDPHPHTGPAEVDLAHLCIRLGAGGHVPDFLRTVHRRHPGLDRDLLGWLASHQARTYLAYKVAMRHPLAPEFLHLAAVPALTDW